MTGVITWDDSEVVIVLRSALKHGVPQQNRQQRNREPLKPHDIALSGRLTKSEWAQLAHIRADLAEHGITLKRWELEVLVRGATIIFNDQSFTYVIGEDWSGFSV